MKLLAYFNTREWAIIVWSILILASFPNVRSSFWSLLKAFAEMWKQFLSAFLYILICIYIINTFSMWELGLIKEVVYWFFGWAIIASYEVIKNGEKNNLKRLFIDLINVSAIIALISSFHTFPFLIELILLPVLVIIIGLPLTQRDKTDMRILSIFNFIQGFAGILALFISVIYVFVNYRIFISIHTLRQFTLPILLSVMFLPFLWIFNKYVEYEHRRRFEKLERERKVRLSKIF